MILVKQMAKKSTQPKATADQPAPAPPTDPFEAYEPDVSYLPMWSKKVKKSVEELKQKLQQGAIEIHKKYPEWTPEQCWAKSRMRIYGSFKADMRSTAVPFTIKTDAIGTPYDFANVEYQKVLEMYRKDPLKTQQKGLVRIQRDDKGKQIVIPWDKKEKTKSGNKNPNFDKALPEHGWIMSVIGLAIPDNKFNTEEYDFLRPSIISISGALADPTNPAYIGHKLVAGAWYKVALTNKTKQDDTEKYELNATRTSKFAPSDVEIQIGPDDMTSYYEKFFSVLGELAEYHEHFKDTPDPKKPERSSCSRFVVTRGQAIDIVLSETEGGNHRLVLDDESLGFQENPESVNCWVPYEYNIDFGKFSEVFVIGKTARTKRKDPVSNQYLEEWQLPNINVTGIVVIDRVEPDVDDEVGGLVEETEEETEEEYAVDPESEEETGTEESVTEEELTDEEKMEQPLSIEEEQKLKEDITAAQKQVAEKKSKPKTKPATVPAKTSTPAKSTAKPAAPAPVETESTDEEEW